MSFLFGLIDSFVAQILKTCSWFSNSFDTIFERSINNRKDSEVFSFYEGPPSANGLPGIHHVMARTVKDIFCRYKTIQGYKVFRKEVISNIEITTDGFEIEPEITAKICKNDKIKIWNITEPYEEKRGFGKN